MKPSRLMRIRLRRKRAFDVHRMERSNRSLKWLCIWDTLLHHEELDARSSA